LLSLIPEEGASIGLAVAVGIFEDHEAIAFGGVEVDRLIGVRIVFGHPEPSALVGGDADWLLNVGFTREHRDVEAFGNFHQVGNLRGGSGPIASRFGSVPNNWLTKRSDPRDCESGRVDRAWSKSSNRHGNRRCSSFVEVALLEAQTDLLYSNFPAI